MTCDFCFWSHPTRRSAAAKDEIATTPGIAKSASQTRQALGFLGGMPQLEQLEIDCFPAEDKPLLQVDDEISGLASLRNLRSLSLRLPWLTHGRAQYVPSNRLEELKCLGTLSDYKGCRIWGALSHLRSLDVSDCVISTQAARELRLALPETAIGFPLD